MAIDPEKQIQQDGPEAELSPVTGETIPQVAITDFERNLFKDGAYIFEPALENLRVEKIVKSLEENGIDTSIKWEDHDLPRWDRSRYMHELRWDSAWKERFSGHIPKHWADVDDAPAIAADVRDAWEHGVQLSTPLIDAVISHADFLLAQTCCQFHTLTTRQLAIVLARDEGDFGKEHAVNGQRKLGVSDEQIDEALVMAEGISMRMPGIVKQHSKKIHNPETPQTTKRSPKIKGFLKAILERN